MPRIASGAVGALFRTAREAQGLSQDQVSDLTIGNAGEVSRSTLSDIERGRSLPNLESLVSLSRVLYLDPSEILERVDFLATVPVDVTGMTYNELRAKAEQYYWSQDFRSALGVYDAMLEHLILDPPAAIGERSRRHATIEIRRAVTLRQCSALRASEASAKRAVELSADVPELQAEAYMVLASLLSHEGLSALSLDTAVRAVALAAAGSPRLKGQALSQKGNVLHRAAKYKEARAAFLEARKYALEAGDHHTMIGLEGNIGACLVELRQPSQARKRFITAVELARKHQDIAMEASWLIELGELAFSTGDLEQADEYVLNALRLSKRVDRPLTEFRVEWLRHRIAAARSPRSRDGRRLARLRKLYARVKAHKGLAVVQEFKAAVIDQKSRGE